MVVMMGWRNGHVPPAELKVKKLNLPMCDNFLQEPSGRVVQNND